MRYAPHALQHLDPVTYTSSMAEIQRTGPSSARPWYASQSATSSAVHSHTRLRSSSGLPAAGRGGVSPDLYCGSGFWQQPTERLTQTATIQIYNLLMNVACIFILKKNTIWLFYWCICCVLLVITVVQKLDVLKKKGGAPAMCFFALGGGVEFSWHVMQSCSSNFFLKKTGLLAL